MGHIQLIARGRSGRGLPGDRRPAREDGRRHRRRSRHHPAARHRQAGARRAGDERADVAARGDAAQRRAAARATASPSSSPTKARWRAANIGPGRLPEPEAILACDRARRCGGPGPLDRPARHRHRRPDPRADRPGARDRQPLLGQAGLRHRRGAGRARRARHPGRRAGRASRRRPGSTRVDVETAARDGRGGARRPARPTPPCWSPRSPTGGSSRRPAKLKKARRAAAARPGRPIPTSSPISPATRSGPACWSASPPRPRTSSTHAQAKRQAQGLRLDRRQ